MFGWTAADWAKAFFGYEDFEWLKGNNVFGGYLIQMWFVRDLFILIALSPLLAGLAHSFPACTLFAASFFYFCGVRPFIVHEQALFYYTLGFFWAEYDAPLFAFVDRIKWRALLPLYAALWISSLTVFSENASCHWFMVLSSCLVALKFSKVVENNGRAFSVAAFLSPVSFWLFAIHMPFLMNYVVGFVWLKVLPMTTPLRCIAEYFGVGALVILIGTASGLLVRKICPPLFSVLNGGRK